MSSPEWKAANKEKLKECRRKWYRQNKEKARAAVVARQKEIKIWFQYYKKTLSCSCGEDHPACLEFHHRDQSKKTMMVSTMVADGWSIERIKKEIALCDVLCSNCHRKYHYEDRGTKTRFNK